MWFPDEGDPRHGTPDDPRHGADRRPHPRRRVPRGEQAAAGDPLRAGQGLADRHRARARQDARDQGVGRRSASASAARGHGSCSVRPGAPGRTPDAPMRSAATHTCRLDREEHSRWFSCISPTKRPRAHPSRRSPRPPATRTGRATASGRPSRTTRRRKRRPPIPGPCRCRIRPPSPSRAGPYVV